MLNKKEESNPCILNEITNPYNIMEITDEEEKEKLKEFLDNQGIKTLK